MSKTVVVRIQSALKATGVALEGCVATKNAKQILASLLSTQVVISNSLQAIPARSRSFTPVKKSLTALSNAVGSLHTGVENRDLSLGKFRESVKLVQDKFLSQASVALGEIVLSDDTDEPAIVEETSPGKFVIKSSDFKTALKSVKEQLNDFFKGKEDEENPVLTEMTRSETAYRTREEKEEANLKARLEHVASLKTKLPLKLKGSFQLLKFPVVPIFNSSILSGRKPTGRSSLVRNFSNPRLLQSLGISHIMVQDYLILEDQFVLAVNLKEMKDFVSSEHSMSDSEYSAKLKDYKAQYAALQRKGMEKQEITNSLKRPKKSVVEASPVDFAKSILEALNEKSPSKYTLVTDQVLVNPRNADILFFWVIPRKTLTALISKGWSKVVQWGFPW